MSRDQEIGRVDDKFRRLRLEASRLYEEVDAITVHLHAVVLKFRVYRTSPEI